MGAVAVTVRTVLGNYKKKIIIIINYHQKITFSAVVMSEASPLVSN
jgi:hypothetical protein